ncbi:multidrug ABC transporter permease [Bacillus spizizenii]|uniref:ABC transporter ATP-binding protein n=2 Tax=Bacillus TaxID=1386 RepID=UPI0007722215|nr:ABC transporter ATP-binding protein [Bacillus spizizenii]KXJ37621.1 multidrug ABC transporter permease [Bacillus spizizenii]
MENKSSLGTLWKKTSPPKTPLVIGILLSLINTACSLIIPLLIKEQIEVLTSGFSASLLTIIIILFLLELTSMSISLYLLAFVGQKIVARLREKIWGKLLKLDVDFYNRNQTGEIISRVTNDTSVTMNLLSTDIADLFSGILSIIGSLVILFILDIPMTLALLSLIPLILFIVLPIAKKIYKVSYEQQEKTSKFSGFLSNVLSNIRLVKAYNAERIEIDYGNKHIDSLYKNGLKRAKIEAILIPLLTSIITLMIVGVVGFGSYRVNSGYLTSGELMAFIMYLFQIVAPVGTFSRFITNVQSASGATQRIFDILEKKEENTQRIATPVKSKPEMGILNIDNISFKYNEKPVLKNISIEIKPNTTTAIVGASGVGKSTLFYLLERFYVPDQGDIILNGVSYTDIDLNQWRGMFSYVSQDSDIVSGTIRENILYGNSTVLSEKDIIDACILANCHDFIMELPDGYDTQVGERGANLSGGQKQRITIARALLRNSPFLLLDEATANLDSESENAIRNSLNNLLTGRTTIIIAHRISTIQNADQIVVLNKGEICGIGTHKELMQKNETYINLVKHSKSNEVKEVMS